MFRVPALTNVHDALKMGLSDELRKYMDVLPLEKLDAKVEKQVFVCFMKSAISSPLGSTAVKIIIERWREGDIDGHLPETPVYFLMQDDIDQDIFDAMAKALDNWDYPSFVYALIHQDSSPEVEMALMRLDRAYGPQDQEVYRVLLDQIERQRSEEGTYNHVVKEYLESRLENVSEYAPRPKWIMNYYSHIPDEQDPELEITEDMTIEGVLPGAEEAIKFLFRKFGEIPLVEEALKKISKEAPPRATEMVQYKDIPVLLSPKASRRKGKEKQTVVKCPMITPEQKEAFELHKDEIKRAFIISYNTGTLKEKVEMLGDLANDISEEMLGKDEKLFTLLGPANPIYGQIIDPDSPCCKYGGCRMLTCIDFENEDEFGVIDEDDPQENIEWFTGACEACHRKIAKKIYALRRPLTFGGWKGTFCSFTCLRKVVPMNDVLNQFIINKIETQLENIGIQDRLVSGEGEINNEELDESLRESAAQRVDGEFPTVSIETIPLNPTKTYDI